MVYCADTDSIEWKSGPLYAIGDTGPGGGLVFQTTDCGKHGLEAAREDVRSVEWGCLGTTTGATETALGVGAENTQKIVDASCFTSGIAADFAIKSKDGGYSDWFLPSKDELNLMYINLHQKGLGDFAFSPYWSSSEVDSNDVWSQGFNDGSQYTRYKLSRDRMRAVRAF